LAKPVKSSMLPGFNHNIKHQGRIYHVQTEDSGVSNPHIITHLFVGGNILATKKTSYADIVNADNLTVVVRELMEEQHKAMLRNLVNGVYDGMDVPSKPAEPTAPPAPGAPAPGAPAPGAPAPGAQVPKPPAPAPPPAKFPPPAAPRPPDSAAVKAPRTRPVIPAHEAPTQPEMPAVGGAQIYKPPPPEKIPAAPPKKPAPRVTVRPSAAKPAAQPPAAQAPATQAPQAAEAGKELPPEVVAARRMADRPKPKDTTGPTIFGEDLISEKSLDEVILGYLAGDGEEGP
jgi:hypothetical protein